MAGADRVEWAAGEWLNPPPATALEGGDLLVTAAEGSDLWRTTSYGFVRDSGHALLAPFAPGTAMEVSFLADYTELYDQAGILVRAAEDSWLKSGVEYSDGAPQLGAVVTHGRSDWSLAPVPEWAGREVTVRASRSGDAVTLRARCEDGPWRMVRLAPLSPEAEATAGPYCCAPQRAGLRVRFTAWRRDAADASLH